ncbi:translation initiation factor IF-2-like [Corvus cornix cornix]|uniref:translation initiation factor IF-2-like n=1 Tax=Corvus cornix cornix TaxID=932674 RepID=UPI00194FB5DB|nr:translation initiation factor IF-2-like [Corvus cornix cornix]
MLLSVPELHRERGTPEPEAPLPFGSAQRSAAGDVLRRSRAPQPPCAAPRAPRAQTGGHRQAGTDRRAHAGEQPRCRGSSAPLALKRCPRRGRGEPGSPGTSATLRTGPDQPHRATAPSLPRSRCPSRPRRRSRPLRPAGPERGAARSSAGRHRCRAPLPPAPPAPALPPPSHPASRPPSPPAAPGTRSGSVPGPGQRRCPPVSPPGPRFRRPGHAHLAPLSREAQPLRSALPPWEQERCGSAERLPGSAGVRRCLRKGEPGCRVPSHHSDGRQGHPTQAGRVRVHQAAAKRPHLSSATASPLLHFPRASSQLRTSAERRELGKG